MEMQPWAMLLVGVCVALLAALLSISASLLSIAASLRSLAAIRHLNIDVVEPDGSPKASIRVH